MDYLVDKGIVAQRAVSVLAEPILEVKRAGFCTTSSRVSRDEIHKCMYKSGQLLRLQSFGAPAKTDPRYFPKITVLEKCDAAAI